MRWAIKPREYNILYKVERLLKGRYLLILFLNFFMIVLIIMIILHIEFCSLMTQLRKPKDELG